MILFGYLTAFLAAFCLGAAVSGAHHQIFLAALFAILSYVCFATALRDRKEDAERRRRRAQRYE